MKLGSFEVEQSCIAPQHHSERQQLLHKLLLENTYQREAISRKIAGERVVERTNSRRQRVVDSLHVQSHPMVKIINDKAETPPKFNARLLQLELKLEVLDLERNLIKSKLAKAH